MSRAPRFGIALVGLAFALAACVPAQSADRTSREVDKPRQLKRITAAVMSDPPSISSQLVAAGSGTIQGGDSLEDLVNGGLAILDNVGDLRPQLAEAVPSVDNGLWKVFPDGRMETTWRIRQGAEWHDGTPFSSQDLVFTAQLSGDRDLPIFRDNAFDAIEAIEAADPLTITVRWRGPYIAADRMFTRGSGFPRPRHLLERHYQTSKESVLQLPYWTEEYVGTGPFTVRQWVRGSHLILAANERYVLGRPRIDEIQVRFIPDVNALTANLLAGQVELTLGRALQLSEAMAIREQWNGQVGVSITNWIALWVQFVNPSPTVLLDVNFRRALLHAVDRQQIVDTLEYGAVPVAHTFVNPRESAYTAIEGRIVRYGYNPRRAAQLIEGLGYSRGRDGLWQDASGRPLSLEVRTNPGHEERVLAVSDYFKQVGIAAEPSIIPDARRADREYNAAYPGVRLWRLPNDLRGVERYHSREAPLPENRFAGGNRARYMNPSLDALIDRYMTTIPLGERFAILADMVHHMTDQLPNMGIHYNTEPVMIGPRLRGLVAREVGGSTEAWNAHLWEVA